MSRTMKLIAATLVAAVLILVASTTSHAYTYGAGKGTTQPIYFLLSLQKCSSSTPHTIHGLWPQYTKTTWPSYCNDTPFTMSAVSDIWSQLEKYWMSCPHDREKTQPFLSHEWTKHGTCSGWDEHTYFQNGLNVYLSGAWKSHCSEWERSCKVRVYPQGKLDNAGRPMFFISKLPEDQD